MYPFRKIAVLLAAVLAMGTVPFSSSAAAAETVSGDCNADGKLTIADVVLLQKWLCHDETVLPDWAAADVQPDGVLNGLDLCRMRQLLQNPETGKTIRVSNVEELFQTVQNAKAGDTIAVAAGTYDYTQYQGAQKIDMTAEGTAKAPITLTAEDPENPPVITGNQTADGYVLHVTGDYWIVENLHITTAQKGVVLDNANHTIVRNCDIGNTGAEAVAIRDGSSDCLVQNCSIHDSGVVTPGYGEGIYIGSSYTVTGFDYHCDNNVVDGCTFRNVAAEHVDVKEYTTGTEIKNCTFYGDGISGENYAGSFLDIAGNDCDVHDNVGYRNQNRNIVAAFELHEQVSGWGYHCTFANNTLYMDRPYGEIDTSRRMYVVDGWYSDFKVKQNLVDYGSGLQEATAEWYNSDQVTFLQ